MTCRIAALGLACLCFCGLLRAEPRSLMLVDFETEADAKLYTQGQVRQISTEHATNGAHSLKFTLASGWVGFQLDDPAMMKKLADYRTLAIDVYNPSTEKLHFYVRIQDALSAAGKESRFEIGYGFLPPGASTLRFSLQALPRLWPHAGEYHVDPKSLHLVFIFTGKDVGKFDPPIVFYIDNVRAEHSGVELPAVDGLRAFQFGAARDTAAFPGFVAVTEKTPPYSAETGFGWQRPPQRLFSSCWNPDELGNSALGGSFVVDLKSGPGTYVVRTCIDPMNQWGWSAQFSARSLKLNGKEVLAETMDGAKFLRERFCMFEDDEDAPATDLWAERVRRISPVRSFEAEVGPDGKLTVEYGGENVAGGMCFFVVYPKARAAEGAAWMSALDSIRKERFDSKINKGGLIPDGAAPDPTAVEKGRGFIAFARSADKALNCASVPSVDERAAALTLHACASERTAAQLGLYPLTGVKGLTIAATDLVGPGGAKIPASAVEMKKVRHYYKRFGNGPCMLLMPLVLQKFQTLDLAPGFTRPVWVTVKVPDRQPAGAYAGTLKIAAGGKSLDVPVSVTVNAFPIEPADDLSISGMGTSAGFWRNAYPAAIESWWQVAEQVFALQAEHGFNAVTGGPSMRLLGVKDGKPDIDFADADRWMDLARKYGLTKLGDGYQGFDVTLGFGRDGSANGAATNDANAQAAYGMAFGPLLKIVYAAVEQHAKEKNWPPRAYALLDEPSGPAVESNRVLVESHVRNAAGSKFSGYYAPADAYSKRECFYGLLQLSILSTVTDPVLQAVHAAGNQSWIYMNPGYPNHMNLRYLYGRWAFEARRRGLDGVTGGFYYVNTVPYYDMSDIEGSWGTIYPSKDGVNSTVWLEQISLGINDYRYLKTLRTRLDAAKKSGGKDAAVKEAEQFLADLAKSCSLETDPVAMKSLASPSDFSTLRGTATRLIEDLGR
jgi:hypothetical protein